MALQFTCVSSKLRHICDLTRICRINLVNLSKQAYLCANIDLVCSSQRWVQAVVLQRLHFLLDDSKPSVFEPAVGATGNIIVHSADSASKVVVQQDLLRRLHVLEGHGAVLGASTTA